MMKNPIRKLNSLYNLLIKGIVQKQNFFQRNMNKLLVSWLKSKSWSLNFQELDTLFRT